MSRWTFSVLAISGAAGLIIGGLYVMLHFATLPVIEYRDTLSWKMANGSVVDLRLTHTIDCYVTYNYTVDAVVYEGNHTRTIGHHNHHEDHGHTELCRRLNETRSHVDVFYDPEKPKTSALKISFVGDFWLAMHSFESLALVSLGGALIFWVSKSMDAIFGCAGAHAALVVVTAIPVSVYRIWDGSLTAILPLVFGILCFCLAVACVFSLRCCNGKNDDDLEKVPESWWDASTNDV